MRQSDFQYLGSQNANDYQTEPSVGGYCLRFKAGGTLNVGDLVQMSAAFTVNKAAANVSKTIGVVVGGDSLPDRDIFTAAGADVATLLALPVVAAVADQSVIVLVLGVAYVKVDGAIAVGGQIEGSVAEAGSVAPFALGPQIGVLIDAAATADNQYRKAYINIP